MKISRLLFIFLINGNTTLPLTKPAESLMALDLVFLVERANDYCRIYLTPENSEEIASRADSEREKLRHVLAAAVVKNAQRDHNFEYTPQNNSPLVGVIVSNQVNNEHFQAQPYSNDLYALYSHALHAADTIGAVCIVLSNPVRYNNQESVDNAVHDIVQATLDTIPQTKNIESIFLSYSDDIALGEKIRTALDKKGCIVARSGIRVKKDGTVARTAIPFKQKDLYKNGSFAYLIEQNKTCISIDLQEKFDTEEETDFKDIDIIYLDNGVYTSWSQQDEFFIYKK